MYIYIILRKCVQNYFVIVFEFVPYTQRNLFKILLNQSENGEYNLISV